MRSGIYGIRNKLNQKIYVGSAVDVKKRWSTHLTVLKQGKHHSHRLQKAWDKFGQENFEWVILQKCRVENLIRYEQQWLEFYQSANSKHGYNILSIAGSPLGSKRTPEVKLKMSEIARRRNYDPEYNAMITARAKKQWQDPAFRKKTTSPEAREKAAAKLRGRPMAEETKQKLSKKAFEQTDKRKKAAQASVETRKKLIEEDPEAKKRLYGGNKGHKMSEESKEKMRQSALRRWAKK